VDAAARTRLVALAVLLAVSVPLIVIAVAGGGSGDAGDSGLRVEPSKQGAPEILIFVDDPEVNEPATTGGQTRVRIECLDRGGEVVFRDSKAWPFTDTDGGKFDPHVHVVVNPELIARIETCRLRGTDPPLEGRKI
jgi:hypothetical protein